jgi:tellurite resistance protein TerC
VAASSSSSFVDIHPGPLAWAGLGVVISMLIAFDLWRHRDDHEPTTKGALFESVVYVAAGLSFAALVWAVWGSAAFGEYLTGYVIEKSLSVDNVFVWSVIFSTFAIPLKYQHRVLFWGIFGALVLRGIFVFAGSAIVSRFTWSLAIFGLLLVFSGVKVLRHRDDEGEHGSFSTAKLLSRFVPVSDAYDGHKFFTRIDGRRFATPLLAVLVVVELTDVIFAVDSVPAILAVSREPYLVISSNAFAILGLRALYFLLANARDRFHYLAHALGVILLYVGCKMIASIWFHPPTWVSLVVIMTLLTAAIVFSLRRSSVER